MTPPVGQPLPPPEKPSTKVAHNGSAKRKPVPSSLPPSRRLSEASVRSEKAPPPPSRRRQPSTATELDGHTDILIVGMPSESQLASPEADDDKGILVPPVEANVEGPQRSSSTGPSPGDLHSDEAFVEHVEPSKMAATNDRSEEVRSAPKPL